MAAAKVAKRARDRFVHESSPQEKSEREQYLTPICVAETAISMLEDAERPRCLDLGAGTGVLSFALADRFQPARIMAIENDPKLIAPLNETLNALECEASAMSADIFDLDLPACDIAVLNPPYRKMAASDVLQDRLPFRCPNYYAAFIWLALKTLKDDGQLVAIVPRSWTNGAYYEGFRRAILSEASIDRVVLYESRRNVFADSGVLQEVMLLKMSKAKQRPVVEVAHLLNPEGIPEYNSIIASEVIRHGSEGTSISFPRTNERSDKRVPFRDVTADQKRNLEIAKDIMRDMGFPGSVVKDRAARLFLAFNGIDMDGRWDKAERLVMTIHESIVRISAGSFDFEYMENSRESLRDDLDVFRHSGYMKRNPDGEKAPNAGTTRHAFIEEVTKCVASYGTPHYEREVVRVKRAAGNVAALNRAESKAFGGVVVLPVTGEALEITKKGQGPIIAGIVEEMLPRFGADAQVAYISDAAGDIFPHCGSAKAQKVREIIETVQPGSLIRRPDVVALDDARRWVFVFEACSSDGPVSERRKEELTELLSPLGYVPVFVTCFASREKMRKWLPDLAWETEAWCLDNPEHLIHLNGEKFLGPHTGE